MADICYGVMNDPSVAYESMPSFSGRRRRIGLKQFRMDPELDRTVMQDEWEKKNSKRNKQKILATNCSSISRSFTTGDGINVDVSGESSPMTVIEPEHSPRYGVSSVCGRRRDMEDAVAVQPSLNSQPRWQYFGVYDGHGCSHVAARCRERLHELVQEELLEDEEEEWKKTMERSFTRMDKEVVLLNETVLNANCKCELQTPDCDAVGSSAVVSIITPEKIVVANCGDSRAVLCRNGKPVPLSSDHKPDRPDELDRIEGAGGRVIYWDCPRVLGVLAMSRAIGDNYLKPYVSCQPEVTVTERTDDDCLILASDGLWDVVSNKTACAVARTCLRGRRKRGSPDLTVTKEEEEVAGSISDKACLEASVLLTKLALARHSSDNVSVVVIDLRRKGHVSGH